METASVGVHIFKYQFTAQPADEISFFLNAVADPDILRPRYLFPWARTNPPPRPPSTDQGGRAAPGAGEEEKFRLRERLNRHGETR